jgi:hypothetical protein
MMAGTEARPTSTEARPTSTKARPTVRFGLLETANDMR